MLDYSLSPNTRFVGSVLMNESIHDFIFHRFRSGIHILGYLQNLPRNEAVAEVDDSTPLGCGLAKLVTIGTLCSGV